MAKIVRVLLVDDHKLFREGLRKLLEERADLRVVAEGADGEEGLTLTRQHRPDLLLFDISMPRMDGIQLAREIGRLDFKVPSMAVTACSDVACWSVLSSEGVLGFLLKTSGKETLFTAIDAVCQGKHYVEPSMTSQLMVAFATRQRIGSILDTLSPREKGILYWLAQGESDAELAQRMILSVKTVKHHVSRLLKKLDVRSRAQAAALAWRMGFASAPLN